MNHSDDARDQRDDRGRGMEEPENAMDLVGIDGLVAVHHDAAVRVGLHDVMVETRPSYQHSLVAVAVAVVSAAVVVQSLVERIHPVVVHPPSRHLVVGRVRMT